LDILTSVKPGQLETYNFNLGILTPVKSRQIETYNFNLGILTSVKPRQLETYNFKLDTLTSVKPRQLETYNFKLGILCSAEKPIPLLEPIQIIWKSAVTDKCVQPYRAGIPLAGFSITDLYSIRM
jgi:hypothetical protein